MGSYVRMDQSGTLQIVDIQSISSAGHCTSTFQTHVQTNTSVCERRFEDQNILRDAAHTIACARHRYLEASSEEGRAPHIILDYIVQLSIKFSLLLFARVRGCLSLTW